MVKRANGKTRTAKSRTARPPSLPVPLAPLSGPEESDPLAFLDEPATLAKSSTPPAKTETPASADRSPGPASTSGAPSAPSGSLSSGDGANDWDFSTLIYGDEPPSADAINFAGAAEVAEVVKMGGAPEVPSASENPLPGMPDLAFETLDEPLPALDFNLAAAQAPPARGEVPTPSTAPLSATAPSATAPSTAGPSAPAPAIPAASGAEAGTAAGAPSPRDHALFADRGGAPDERLTDPSRSELLDDLAQLLPRQDDPVEDQIETEPVPDTDIFAPILKTLMSERELSEHLAAPERLSGPAGAAELRGQASQAEIDAIVPHEYNAPGIVVRQTEEHPVDTTIVVRPARFRAWNKFWNGYLGWESLDRPSEWFVLGKLSLRFVLFGLLPVLLVALISLPSAGRAYARTSADYTKSALLYGRPVEPLAAPDTLVTIADGTAVSANLLIELRGLYGAYFADVQSGFASGDPTPLAQVLSADIYPTFAAQIKGAYANKWTIAFYGAGQSAAGLAFTSATPASGPATLTASNDTVSLAISDSAGDLLSVTPYAEVDVVFSRTAAGWCISSLVMVPVPGPSPSS